ncbi:MAG: diguanylate cyclase, partial [Myxococcaceae bacterium]|nr:diguanylate cyclase [Myxococcaceae bacterium]
MTFDGKSGRPAIVSELVHGARREALSPEVAAEFQRYRFEKALPITRLTLALGAGLYGAFAILDLWVVPQALGPAWTIRGSFCLAAAAVFAFTYSRFFERLAQPILAAMTLFAGLGIVAIITLADEAGGGLYYAGLILVLFMAYTLLQLRFAYAAVTCLLLMGAYEWVAISVKAIPSLVLVSNNFFFFSANAIGMLAGYTIERGVKTDFLQRRVIETQRREADQLLRNVLPEEIARRLKAEEGAIADYIPDVTVLFADF